MRNKKWELGFAVFAATCIASGASPTVAGSNFERAPIDKHRMQEHTVFRQNLRLPRDGR